MKKVINILGVFMSTVMIISIPILCTCSYLLNWHDFIKFILTWLIVLEMIGIGGILYVKVDEEEE